MKLSKIAFLLCLFLLAASVFAAEPVRFHVESIEVTGGGARIQSIVIAQSLLREGQTYSEAELADAVSRIRRLPFVRAVGFSLAKGSERGLYRLVITVDPMKSLYFDAQARSVSGDNQTPRTFNYGALTVGGRLPVGSSGMVRASVSGTTNLDFDSDEPRSKPTFALGYSLYRIGSRAIFADATIFGSQPESGLPVAQSRVRYGNQWGTQVVIGVPLRGSQSVRAEWNGFRTPMTFETAAGTQRGTSEYDNVQLFWLRDTTDDPLYPLHGSLLKAGAVGGRGRSVGFNSFPDPTLSVQHYDYRGGEVSGSYYWSLANDRALSAHGRYGNTRTYFESPFESSYDTSQSSVGAGFTQRLSGPNTDAWIDFRLDGTRYGTSSFNDQISARLELAHRSKWGVARIGVSYNGQRN
jgi:outer membrane protein assembly factor BamA